MIATLTSKGQLTLPKALRDELGLRSGDHLDCTIREDGRIEIVPVKQPASRLRGILPKPAEPRTIDEMGEAVAERAARYGRD